MTCHNELKTTPICGVKKNICSESLMNYSLKIGKDKYNHRLSIIDTSQVARL